MQLAPNSRWWIKGDGTDVTKGLWESVTGKWAGDVDLTDGTLNRLYKQYESKINNVNNLGMQDLGTDHIRQQLVQIQDQITSDMEFLSSGMRNFTICVCTVLCNDYRVAKS